MLGKFLHPISHYSSIYTAISTVSTSSSVCNILDSQDYYSVRSLYIIIIPLISLGYKPGAFIIDIIVIYIDLTIINNFYVLKLRI